jgi:hypothetical protein
VTAAVPVELSVTVCVTAVFTASLPKLTLDVLTPNVDRDAPSCRAKFCDAPPALAISVAVCAVLTAVTVVVKGALVEPAATVTEAGTVAAVLLLARLTTNPPVAAAAFSVTVQLSVPAPVIEPLEQVSPVNTGTPAPLRLTAVDAPVDELLVTVNVPEAAPAVVGSNCTVKIAV